MKNRRKAGDIFLELEVLLDELIDSHDFQFGDILNFVYGHLMVHRPDAQEEYTEGGNPIFYYGCSEVFNKKKKNVMKIN